MLDCRDTRKIETKAAMLLLLFVPPTHMVETGLIPRWSVATFERKEAFVASKYEGAAKSRTAKRETGHVVEFGSYP